jgi:hypothetical protein
MSDQTPVVLDMLAESHEVRITQMSDFLKRFCSGKGKSGTPTKSV